MENTNLWPPKEDIMCFKESPKYILDEQVSYFNSMFRNIKAELVTEKLDNKYGALSISSINADFSKIVDPHANIELFYSLVISSANLYKLYILNITYRSFTVYPVTLRDIVNDTIHVCKNPEGFKNKLREIFNSQSVKDSIRNISSMFPEFAEREEREDERIRKAILELVRQSSEILDKQNQNNMIAWLEKQGEQKPTEWSEEDERLRYSCIKHSEEELEEIRKDRFGHSEIISDLKEECRERINWLKSLKERLS